MKPYSAGIMLIYQLRQLNNSQLLQHKFNPEQGTILSSKMKLEKPEPFTGILSKLQNFLFSVQLYSSVCTVISSTEIVKVAVTLLTEKALTWWRSVS